MKLALRFSIALAAVVSAFALTGLLHALAGLFLAGPFAQVLDHAGYRDMEHAFYLRAGYFLIALMTTVWLWRTYRRQYSKPRGSNLPAARVVPR